MPDRAAHPVILWLSVDQLPLARAVCELAELRPVGAGCPERGQGGAVASELDTRQIDDLRSALASEDAALFWIAAPGDFGIGGGSGADDAAALVAARGRGAIISTLEPIPASATDLASGWLTQSGAHRPADCAPCGPRLRLGRPFRDAAEVLESFGAIRSAMVETWRRPSQGSLGAQVYDAMDLLCALLGEPETVDAAYVAPGAGAGRPRAGQRAGDSLRGFRGDLTASLRFGDGRTASLVASDHAGRWNRTVTLLGERGRLRVFDDGFEWIDAAGEKVDASRQSTREAPPKISHDIAAIADDLSRRLDPSIPAPGPVDHATVMAICQATLLSARTGQCESPASIHRMTGA